MLKNCFIYTEPRHQHSIDQVSLFLVLCCIIVVLYFFCFKLFDFYVHIVDNRKKQTNNQND